MGETQASTAREGAARPPGAGVGLLPAIAIFALLALAPLLGLMLGAERYVDGLFARCMIFAIAAIGLDLALGYAGLVSFGHAAFIGIGAYAAGILDASGIDDIFIGASVALAASGVFALATGAVSLRTRGVHFIMITLAFGQMAYFVANSLKAYGGDDGLSLNTRATLFGHAVFAPNLAFYALVFALLAAVYALARAIWRSRFGQVLRAARENEQRAAALGFEVRQFRLAVYTLSGMIAGLAGFLLANQTEFVSPAYMTWQRSGDLIIMVMVGGVAAPEGAILGAVILVLAEQFLSGFTEHWRIVFGPCIVLVAIFARGGIVGALRRWRHG